MKAVGEHLFKNPIVPTQDAGQIPPQDSQQTIDGVTKGQFSMEIYEILTKHLNVLQIYIWEKGFLMENRSSPLLDVVNNVKILRTLAGRFPWQVCYLSGLREDLSQRDLPNAVTKKIFDFSKPSEC